jgi:hypothetical protein
VKLESISPSSAPWVAKIFWVDGLAALSAGAFVLVLRRFLAELYALPLGLITFIGLVNVGYSAFGLTLASKERRPGGLIVGLAAANGFWACVCVVMALRFASDAHPLGLAHILFEATFVAALAAAEWKHRHALAR